MNINVDVKETIKFEVAKYKHYISKLKQNNVGVYVFYDKYDQPIYIGKTKNMNTRVPSHINGKSNVPQIKELAEYCIVYSIENYAMADIYETVLINDLKPLFNIDKAMYGDFIRSADELLYEVEEEIQLINEEITELHYELEEAEDLGEIFIIQRSIKNKKARRKKLTDSAAVYKRRGGRPLENKTGEEDIRDEKSRKSAAFLSIHY